jgi:UDP-glucose 4-epimerase
VHVSDLIAAMIFAHGRGGDEPRQIYNIGPDDEGFEVARIAETVIAASKTGARIRYAGGNRGWVGDIPRFRYSVEKLGQLGWRTSMSSAEAVAKAVGEIALERGFS